MRPRSPADARALARRCILELALAAVPAAIVLLAPRAATLPRNGSVYLLAVKGGRAVLVECRPPGARRRRSYSPLRLQRAFSARGLQAITVRQVADLERAFGLGPAVN